MNFVCPHCGIAQIVTSKAMSNTRSFSDIGKTREMEAYNNASRVAFVTEAVRCASQSCRRLTVNASLMIGLVGPNGAEAIYGSDLRKLRLYPAGSGKPFPAGVPEAMLEDYNEAWAIIDLSPKSSATLARRCLQAMIRDFCGIKERTLFHEIETLEKRLGEDTLPKGVEPETVQAMKVLKDKGNIGAHMTEENGKVVGVDPDEAENLLGLIEMLFTDWYVARHKRQERLAAIEAMATPPRPQRAPTDLPALESEPPA